MTRKLTFQERLLLAAQKDPNIGPDSEPRSEFERRFRELDVPETTESTTQVTVESLVNTNLHDFMKHKPE